MNKTGKILLAVGAVIAVAVVAVLLLGKPAATPTNNTSESQREGGTNSSTAPPEVTITYDGTIFTLSSTTMKSGGVVKVANKSSKDLEFNSDPHPVHTDNSELNTGRIPAGKSASFNLTTKGKWGFHNHLNASQKGELIVE